MKVIILAAGMGTRLKEKTENYGKALIELNTRPLIDYALAFTDYPFVTHRFVVGGFAFDLLKKHLYNLKPQRTTLLENKDYKKGNILTLKAALSEFNDDMLIMNVDHIYNPLIFQVVRNNISGITGVVDSDRILTDDDMKVFLDDWGRIVKIDKKLTEFHKGYIGMTTVSKALIPDYINAFNEVLKIKGETANVEAILAHLAETDNNPKTIDVSSFKWLEIDTQEELEAAEKAVKNEPDTFKYF